ncbi:hypothetical protein FRUB_02679 [Fimbriiglobus ruber]|uniref:Uncharacterized protein n=1 Tax=Fimbriiglobus ruber TaxID=1908690 RepID=A0A225DNM5_9BACT|nr:hypothetical protein FRUB_02679 [Fimbriiglobus ruber]
MPTRSEVRTVIFTVISSPGASSCFGKIVSEQAQLQPGGVNLTTDEVGFLTGISNAVTCVRPVKTAGGSTTNSNGDRSAAAGVRVGAVADPSHPATSADVKSQARRGKRSRMLISVTSMAKHHLL